VAQLLGAVTALLTNAISFLVSAACLLGARARTPAQLLPPRPAAGRRLTLRQEMAEGLLLVARDSFLRQLSIPTARHQT
jgi:hypothetical protein